jgi:hypothetical protein
MSAIGFVLAGVAVIVLALLFGWVFLEVVVGLAILLVAVVAIVFIAIIVAVAVGIFRAIAS